MKLYEKDLDSDVESVDEAPSPRKVVQSPVKLSERERKESIRRVAEMNKVSPFYIMEQSLMGRLETRMISKSISTRNLGLMIRSIMTPTPRT